MVSNFTVGLDTDISGSLFTYKYVYALEIIYKIVNQITFPVYFVNCVPQWRMPLIPLDSQIC